MKDRTELSNEKNGLRLGNVGERECTVGGYLDGLPCVHYVTAKDKATAIEKAKLEIPDFDIYYVDID